MTTRDVLAKGRGLNRRPIPLKPIPAQDWLAQSKFAELDEHNCAREDLRVELSEARGKSRQDIPTPIGTVQPLIDPLPTNRLVFFGKPVEKIGNNAVEMWFHSFPVSAPTLQTAFCHFRPSFRYVS